MHRVIYYFYYIKNGFLKKARFEKTRFFSKRFWRQKVTVSGRWTSGELSDFSLSKFRQLGIKWWCVRIQTILKMRTERVSSYSTHQSGEPVCIVLTVYMTTQHTCNSIIIISVCNYIWRRRRERNLQHFYPRLDFSPGCPVSLNGVSLGGERIRGRALSCSSWFW